MIVCCLPGTLWYIPKWRESDDVCDGKLIHIVKWRQNPPHLSLCMLAWARFSRENPSRASQQKTHFSISRDYQTSALCMLWSREKDAKSCMMSKFDFKEEKKLDCVTFAFCLFARLLRSVCAKVSKCQRDFSPRENIYLQISWTWSISNSLSSVWVRKEFLEFPTSARLFLRREEDNAIRLREFSRFFTSI